MQLAPCLKLMPIHMQVGKPVQALGLAPAFPPKLDVVDVVVGKPQLLQVLS